MHIVFNQADNTRAQKATIHIKHRLMVSLWVNDATACRRSVPDESTTILNETDRRRHRYRLSGNGGNRDIGNLTADGVDERIVLGMAYHQPSLLDPRCLRHEIFGQVRIIGIIGRELSTLQVELLHTTTQCSNPDVTPFILCYRPYIVVQQCTFGIRSRIILSLPIDHVDQTTIIGAEPY